MIAKTVLFIFGLNVVSIVPLVSIFASLVPDIAHTVVNCHHIIISPLGKI